MRTLARSALTVAALTAVVPAASASASYENVGGCGYDTRAVPGSSHHTGTINAQSVTYRRADMLPVDAVLYCRLRVNGVAQGEAVVFTGYGVQIGVSPVSYEAPDSDQVDICQRVVYAGGAEEDPWDCIVSTQDPIPPQEVWDLVHSLLP